MKVTRGMALGIVLSGCGLGSEPPPASAPVIVEAMIDGVAPPSEDAPSPDQLTAADAPPESPDLLTLCERSTYPDCFAQIPSGAAQMGTQSTDANGPVYDPSRATTDLAPREVRLPELWVQKGEATVSQYDACVAAGACSAEPQAQWEAFRKGDLAREQGASGLLYGEAEALCVFLGGRVPTEEEWAGLARGKEGRRFPWGAGYRCPVTRLEDHVDMRPRWPEIRTTCGPLIATVTEQAPQGLIDDLGHMLAGWETTAILTFCAEAEAMDAPARLQAVRAALADAARDAVGPLPARGCELTAQAPVEQHATGHPHGLRALSGGLAEWTATPWPGAEGSHVLRGGSWVDVEPVRVRLAARAQGNDAARAPDVGVRCVRDTAP